MARDEYFERFGIPLPDAEHVRIPCVWITEFCLPTHLAGLQEGLVQLGLGDRTIYAGGPKIVDYLVDRRQRIDVINARPLGDLVRPGDTGRFVRPIRCEMLPELADYIHVSCWFPGTSVLCLTFQFILTEKASDAVDRVLHQQHPTDYDAQAFKRAAHSPGFDHVEAEVEVARRDLHQALQIWLANHIPGVCATRGAQMGYASCEFVVTTQAKPFEPDSKTLLQVAYHLIDQF